jgi:hypothetical protein
MRIPMWLSNTIQKRLKEVIRVRRELRKARTLKEERGLEGELRLAEIECGYAQHWVMLTQGDVFSAVRPETRCHTCSNNSLQVGNTPQRPDHAIAVIQRFKSFRSGTAKPPSGVQTRVFTDC